MDATKLHLILNYYPAFAAVVGTVLLGVGLARGSEKLKRASLKLFIVVAAFTLPVFVTGEIAGGSGARNGTYSGATADGLERHKSFARPAFLMIEACGIAAIFGLLLMRYNSNAVRWVLPLTLVIAIAASVAVVTTIHLGRQVKWAAMAPPASIGV
ncbi:MAG: hypothetical protein ACKVQW_01440 [Pyrinomonadaceae bacterium]